MQAFSDVFGGSPIGRFDTMASVMIPFFFLMIRGSCRYAFRPSVQRKAMDCLQYPSGCGRPVF